MASLYRNGAILTLNPIESSSMYLFVVLVCAGCEYLFSESDKIESKFFKDMLEILSEEFLVVGLMSLALTWFGTFVELTGTWNTMVQWAQVCLLFMLLFLVFFMIGLVSSTFRSNKNWKKIEETRLHVNLAQLHGRELYFRQATQDFQRSCEVFGVRPGAVHLSNYLLKMEKKNLSMLADLSWRTWVALSIVLVANVLRTKAISGVANPMPGFTNPVEPGSFIAVIGYGTFALFLFSHRTLEKRLVQYLERRTQGDTVSSETLTAIAAAAALGLPSPTQQRGLTMADLDDPRAFLLWRSLENTIAIFQCVLLFFVWYLSAFSLNMLYLVLNLKTSGLSFGLLVVALVPIFAFLIMFPWTLTMVALLSSLGTATDVERLKHVVSSMQELGATGLLTSDAVPLTHVKPSEDRHQHSPDTHKSLDPEAIPTPKWAPARPLRV